MFSYNPQWTKKFCVFKPEKIPTQSTCSHPKKSSKKLFFPFSGALRLFKQKCAVCLRRRDNYRHISSKAFPGFFESIFEWWGKSKAIPSAQNQAPLSTWTSSSWTTAFPSGVKCNPSLQITKKKWLLSYDNQSPYWLMIWIFLLINLKNEREKNLRNFFCHPLVSCILVHRSIERRPISSASSMQFFAYFPATSFVLSGNSLALSPYKDLFKLQIKKRRYIHSIQVLKKKYKC